jgi:HSP20 family molecular chaperone IbpA
MESVMSKPSVERVASSDDRSLPVFDEFDQITDRIRRRAYELFKLHETELTADVDHWLRAEREVCWPGAELCETDEKVTCRVALAGFEADDIAVTATPSEVIVKATLRHESSADEESDTPETVCWSDFRYEEVYRRFGLPAEIVVDDVRATLDDGMLTITAPKAVHTEEDKPERRVPVSTAA